MIWPLVWRSRLDALQAQYDVLKAQQAYMVDREAFNAVVDERDRLRAQNDDLLDHVRRMDRRDHGLPEEKPKPREKAEPMPREIWEDLKKWPSVTRERMRAIAQQQRREGRPWREIGAEIKAKQKDNNDDTTE